MTTYQLDQEALQPKYDSVMLTFTASDMEMCRSLMEDVTSVLDHALNNRDDEALTETLLAISAKAMAWRESLMADTPSPAPTRHLAVVR